MKVCPPPPHAISLNVAWITGKLSLPEASIQGCGRKWRAQGVPEPATSWYKGVTPGPGRCHLPKATEDTLGRGSEEEGKRVPCLASSLKWSSPPCPPISFDSTHLGDPGAHTACPCIPHTSTATEKPQGRGWV